MSNDEIIDVVSKAEYDEKGKCTNIIYRRKDSIGFTQTMRPTWDFCSYDYAIIPKKRIVDLTKEDLDKRIKDNQTLAIISTEDIINWQWYNESGIKFCYDATITPYSNLKRYKWADGTNCYKETEE